MHDAYTLLHFHAQDREMQLDYLCRLRLGIDSDSDYQTLFGTETGSHRLASISKFAAGVTQWRLALAV